MQGLFTNQLMLATVPNSFLKLISVVYYVCVDETNLIKQMKSKTNTEHGTEVSICGKIQKKKQAEADVLKRIKLEDKKESDKYDTKIRRNKNRNVNIEMITI